MDIDDGLARLRRHVAELEEELAWEKSVSASLAILARRLLSPASIEEISRLILDYARRLTDSRSGCVGYVDPETGRLVCPAFTGEVWDGCREEGGSVVFEESRGLLGWVLENREPVLANRSKEDPSNAGTPWGPVEAERFISVPALGGEELVGLISLADSSRDYTQRDLSMLQYLADFYALAVQRERAQRALLDSEERYRRIYDYTGEAIYTYDTSLKLIGVNRKACELIGYDEEELLGTNIMELNILHPDDFERTYRDIQRLFGGEVVRDELRFIKRDGTVVLGDVTGAPLYGRNGEIIAFTNVARDITESKRAEEELKRTNRELDAYAYVVSHDLRGPLSAIISAAGMLEELAARVSEGEGGSQLRRLARVIAGSADNAEELILNLLSLAKAGQAPRETARLEVSEVVRKVVGDRAQAIQEGGVEMRVDEEMGELHADPTHIYQLFGNLIDNAIEYNDNPEPVVSVSYLGTEEGVHRYVVSDNGPGIPEEDLERIFEPLFRGKGGGTGIGLATVKKIVDIYGGGIRAYNQGGACFEFTLRDWKSDDRSTSG